MHNYLNTMYSEKAVECQGVKNYQLILFHTSEQPLNKMYKNTLIPCNVLTHWRPLGILYSEINEWSIKWLSRIENKWFHSLSDIWSND